MDLALFLLSLLCVGAHGLGQTPILSWEAVDDGLPIVGDAAPVRGQIRVSPDDYWGVIRAAGDLAADFGRATGTNLTLSNGVAGALPAAYAYQPVDNLNNTVYRTTGNASFAGPAYADPVPADTVILAGTLGRAPAIDALVAAGRLNVSAVSGRWEAFVSALVEAPLPGCARALVIAGSDARGTIYGLYDVSEQLGVSPWHFWADVPVARRPTVWVRAGPKVQKSPSVRYRGLFLNDEQPALTGWVASRWPDAGPYGDAGYGADFYALVFALLLRLRANYLWPALWGAMLAVDDPANQPLADAFGIVLGSSHTEPLLRAQNEFGKFYAGAWAYDQNNATIDDYFRYGVQRARPYADNALWTVGMRGSGDTAIEGLGTAAIVSLLTTLVANQRAILASGLGVADVATVPQLWCLYKEVQSYLDAGLAVPDDVTLLWSDDNWGNLRRLPRADEQARAGGAGVYYHFDYVGDPRSYKWINTIQLAKTAEQMGLALARGADRVWVVNVGDLKGLELPLAHFLDLAYDADRWAGVAGTAAWAEAWAAREFGPWSGNATQIADLVGRYGVLAARRKFELLEPQTYSVLHYGEADAVLAQWAALVADAQAAYDALDAAAQPAFFETVLHPALAGAVVHRIAIGAAYNQLYAGQKRNAANEVIRDLLQASAEDANLTARWDALLGGKWAHMMDQTHLGYDGYWQQPMRNTLPPLTFVQTAAASLAGHVGVGVEGSNATVPGDDPWHTNSVNTLFTPPLEPYGAATRYFDVFSRGTRACVWTASVAEPWIHLSQTTGTVGGSDAPDTRVYVSVTDWTLARTTNVTINVTTPCRGTERYGYSAPVVRVPVVVRSVPADFVGFVESDRTVAIDGPHYQAIVSSGHDGSLTYQTLGPHYGRNGSGGVTLYPLGTEKRTVATAPALEYRLYLFSNRTANVTVLLSPAQNYLGDNDPLAYAVALYPSVGTASEPVLVEPVGASVGASMPSGWGYAVGDSAWGVTGNKTTTSFALAGGVAAGTAYTLRLWLLLPGIVVQKIVVNLGGVRPSYLGPPESFLAGQ